MRLNAGLKFALFLGALALVVAAVFLNNLHISGESNPLAEAIEGGESTLAAIGRSHESLTNFVKNEQEVAGDLLKTAQASQEHAKARLTSAGRTDDDFVHDMAENYEILLNSSHVMTQGVDNLLAVSDDLERTLNHYREGEYEEAAEEASVCLETLSPLIEQFELRNQSLGALDYRYVASGHRDQVKHAVVQYGDEMGIYLEYILLLESIIDGVDYLNAVNSINDLFNQLQHALANKDYVNAQNILQEISQQLQRLKEPPYQGAASTASNLNPSLLDGDAYNTAQDLKNQLRELERIEGFEDYLESVGKYMEALSHFEEGNMEAAEETIVQGLSMLGEGESEADAEVQRFYAALRGAFGSLAMQIRGQPDQG